MKLLPPLLALILLTGFPGTASAGPSSPLRVFIRAGKKTHGPGEHDSPAFLAEWKRLLASRGAVVEGAQRFPSAQELARADVLVVFAANGGNVAPDERARLASFLGRGGGIVALHDGVVSDDARWWKTIIGGAFEKKRSKYHHGNVGLYFDRSHPITRNIANHFLDDEIYWDLHLDSGIKVLANGFRTVQEITPQVWVYEARRHRAFASLLGHKHATFALPHHRAMVLRGIAWAGRRDPDMLVDRAERAALRYPPGGPVAPARAAETLTLHPEWNVRLVAAEPDVVKPVSIDWDARGRMWVAQTPGYPDKAAVTGAAPRDNLVVFEDRDGDGRWDERRVFCDKLDLITSFAFHRDGVIAAVPPDIERLRDTDGDGRCDTREVMFTGFGIGDTHAVVSSFRWGMDGWIYADQGYSGSATDVRGRGGRRFGKIGNGIFRFKPDGSAIEMVASLNGNTWGIDFAWDGELFFTMANGAHLSHVVLPDAVLGRGQVAGTRSRNEIVDHKELTPAVRHTLNPYVQIDHVGGFTAAAGSTVYTGGAWPAKYDYTHFVSEPTVNLVHHDVVAPKGVTYGAKRSKPEEFLTSRDLWFRPVETRIGPDGALYVADFYNLAAVHNDTRGPPHDAFNAAVRPDRDHEHGRLWRVQHEQAITLPQPRLEGAGAEALTAALAHPNRWHRMTAHRLLAERRETSPTLRGLLDAAVPARARTHALWLLDAQGALDGRALASALRDSNAGVRKNAARIAGLREPDRALAAALLQGLRDRDARVRIEAVVALGAATPTPAITRALVALFPLLSEDWSRSAVVGSAAKAPVEAIAAALPAPRPAAMEPLVAALAEIVGERQDAALAGALVAKVAAMNFAEGEGVLAQAALARLAHGLRDAVTLFPSSARPLEALLASRDLRVASAALPLVGRLAAVPRSLSVRLQVVTAAVVRAMEDAKRSEDDRVAFTRVLLALNATRGQAADTCGRILAGGASATLAARLIEALGATAEPQVAPALLAAFPRLGGPARELAVAQLMKRADWSLALVAALEALRLRPQDIGPAALFRLRNHPDRAVASKASQVIDTVAGAAAKEKDQVIAKLLPAVQQPGDRGRGRDLFTTNCLVCHSYKNEGKTMAPDLTGMGARGPADLLVHVIDPNRAVEPNFIAFDVTTKTGAAFTGVIGREMKDAVLLRNATGEVEVKRADIATFASSGLSLMPEGFEALGPEALRDLLGYLCFDEGRYRTIDLGAVATGDTRQLALAGKRGLPLRSFGSMNVADIPFQIAVPGANPAGKNVVLLPPRTRVELTLGFTVARLHVLGGIAGNGATGTTGFGADPAAPIVKVTYQYADGASEEKLLHDGVEFATWDRRVDVPGSLHVDGIVPEGVRGQVRRFTLTPARRQPLHRLVLESTDAEKAPVFLALTAELPEAPVTADRAERASQARGDIDVLVVGGGKSHDFERWFHRADVATLSATLSALGRTRVRYTEKPAEILPALADARVLVLSANQPLLDPALRKGIFAFVERGNGLVVVHAGAWYSWLDWPEYNRLLVGGGARSHEKYGEMEVTVGDRQHAVMRGVSEKFRLKDELYRFEKDPLGPAVHVLAAGASLTSGERHPVVWTLAHGKGRIVSMTLGHDGAAHDHPAYRTLLRNAVAWVAPTSEARASRP